MLPSFNKFSTLPYVPYNIVLELLNNDNICKLLKYNTYDCLSKPNLSYDEKIAMIWKNEDQMQNYNIFLTNTKANMMTEAMDIMQVYRHHGEPTNQVLAVEIYRFDFLFGSKTAMVEYNGIPCNRGDVFEMELMKSLNGVDVGGTIGLLKYINEGDFRRMCSSDVGIGNNSTFTGITVLLGTQVGSVENGCNS